MAQSLYPGADVYIEEGDGEATGLCAGATRRSRKRGSEKVVDGVLGDGCRGVIGLFVRVLI